ncbi:nucleoside phosphorylase [Neolewinella lacunae]|uniref:Uridine phosphorylase n=1 Tax=Neolewinella lacunae TaxID=1517758 RepID=A0A923PKY0_9BACT|nr:nucleoside phosphorylase [Neolewinella lacunae]MBC6995955.1 nucleoside phosphorylase [Neolewinella lacunae]MDN3635201.1 nucleoside phosphorylase [Neolewinella lacunae]
MLAPSELILRPNGSLYHLDLLPGQVAETIITVGDPERVRAVSDRFDRVELRVEAREFVTHTGTLDGRRLTVVSTGIGTDNVDIVFNELDALFNVDLARREIKSELTRLTFVRLGTSGAFQPDLPLDSFLLSTAALAMDGLLPFYLHQGSPDPAAISLYEHLEDAGVRLPVPVLIVRPDLPPAFAATGLPTGMTLTAAGFYAPQGRSIRLASGLSPRLLEALRTWQDEELRLTNIEMETAGIYGLATALGHRAVSLSALLANRAAGTFSRQPAKTVDALISKGLELILQDT